MNARPRVIFVNRFYWPDEPATAQLLTDLAEALAKAGHLVTIITSRQANGSVAKTELRHGVEIIRVPGPRLGRRNALLKAVDFFGFALGALRQISGLLKPHDVLVVMTDPPLLSIPATWVARRRGARVVHWIQDVYPEIAMSVSGVGIASLLRPWRDRAWQNADACVVLGDDMSSFVRARGVVDQRIIVSPNWAPAGLTTQPNLAIGNLRLSWGLVGKFVVMYSGNLGRVHDLTPIVLIAEQLRTESDIVFIFVGEGAQKKQLQSTANKRALKNILFRPAMPRYDLGTTLALANVHLVTLRGGCESFVFPSKLYGIAAVGRPVLFIGPRNCELAQTVTNQGFGQAFARDDIASATAVIRELRNRPDRCLAMGKSASAFYAHSGGLAKSAATWTSMLSGMKPLADRHNAPPKSDQ